MNRQNVLKNAPKLDECPWCNITPQYVGSDTYKDWGIECQNLKCLVASELVNKYPTAQAAAKVWNYKTKSFKTPNLGPCHFDSSCNWYKDNKCFGDVLDGEDMTNWDNCPFDGIYPLPNKE